MPRKRSRARDSGARPRLSALQRAERARSIAAAHASGQTWAQVAAAHDISPSSARRIAADVRGQGDPRAPDALKLDDPLQPVRSLMERLDWAAVVLQREAIEATNASARVGAVRTAVAVEIQRCEVYVALGVTPSQLSTLYHRAEFDRLLGDLVDVLKRRGAVEAMADVVELREARLAPPAIQGAAHAA